jgi:hypothetical protein
LSLWLFAEQRRRDREAGCKYLFEKERGESTIRKKPKDRDRNIDFERGSGEVEVGEG